MGYHFKYIQNRRNMTKQDRIIIVNDIIKAISNRGRNFFRYKEKNAYIFERNGRLFMYNEYNGTDMYLSTKFGYPPKGWHHGGTIWGLTKDFKEFIITGEKTNGNNGYGGLYSKHWGYDEVDMQSIQETAVKLGYL